MKTKYNIFTTLLLFAALLFTACAEELNQNEKETVEPEIESELTDAVCFSSGTNEGTRTAMFPNGHFKWLEADNIFIKDRETGEVFKSEKTTLYDGGKSADFIARGNFGKDKYDIIYAGSNATETSLTSVTIPAEQIQSTANNSDHYALAGDCGVAEAVQNERGKYSFELQHQMVYLMFEPRVSVAGKRVWIRKIKITELDGGNIRGTFNLGTIGTGGVDDSSITDGNSVVTVYCGSDVKAVDAGTVKPENATNNGFEVNNNNYAPYDTDNNARIYAVIRPGTWNLKFEYEVVSDASYKQGALHNYDEAEAAAARLEHTHSWEDGQSGYSEWVPKTPGSFTYNKNSYYKLRHAFSVPQPNVEGRDYKFEEYYMWGAKRWFWNGVSSYPVNYDGSQATDAPTYTGSNDSRWFYVNTTWGDKTTERSGGYDWPTNFTSENKYRSQQANGQGLIWSSTANSAGLGGALNANEASFYVIYGDAHYDDTTPWTLQQYCGYNGYVDPVSGETNDTVMVCYGGVWLKKRAKIVADTGLPWPGRDDSSKSGNLAAPFIHDAETQGAQPFENKRYNLRYCAPWSNYRHTYTNYNDFRTSGKFKKPWELDPSKNKDDYFFVPALGRIEYNHAGSEGIPTFTLCGAQGFYWTRTPVMYNFGGTAFYFDSESAWNTSYTGNFNAFYLNIHFNYFALSWQQGGQYVKTGMRVATDAMFK